MGTELSELERFQEWLTNLRPDIPTNPSPFWRGIFTNTMPQKELEAHLSMPSALALTSDTAVLQLYLRRGGNVLPFPEEPASTEPTDGL